MTSGKKRGRKPRALRPVEKLWLKEFSGQLSKLVEKRGRSAQVIEAVAKELHVCRASVYNYLRKSDPPLPSYSVLEQAHRAFRFQFSHTDFSVAPQDKSRPQRELPRQGVLPFLESIQKDDVEVLSAKPVKSENALEITVQIRFAG